MHKLKMEFHDSHVVFSFMSCLQTYSDPLPMGGGSKKADQDPVAARIPHDVDTLINPCL